MTIDPKDLGSRAVSGEVERLADLLHAEFTDPMTAEEAALLGEPVRFVPVSLILAVGNVLRGNSPAPVVPSNLEDKDLGKEGSS